MRNFNKDYNKYPFKVIVVDNRHKKNPILTIIFVLLILGVILGLEFYGSSSKNRNIDANLSPYPVYNGKIIVYPDYECICPLKVEAQSGMSCYVRLHYLGQPYSDVSRRLMYSYSGKYESDIAFYVEEGRTVEIHIPVGIYQFYYATGKTFYGVKELFGKKTSCFTSDEKLYFYVDGYTYAGHEITLRRVPHGNFRTHGVNRSSFPTD